MEAEMSLLMANQALVSSLGLMWLLSHTFNTFLGIT